MRVNIKLFYPVKVPNIEYRKTPISIFYLLKIKVFLFYLILFAKSRAYPGSPFNLAQNSAAPTKY